MRFGDGTLAQKFLFALLVGIYAVGVALTGADKLERVGAPEMSVSDPVTPMAAVYALTQTLASRRYQ